MAWNESMLKHQIGQILTKSRFGTYVAWMHAQTPDKSDFDCQNQTYLELEHELDLELKKGCKHRPVSSCHIVKHFFSRVIDQYIVLFHAR